MIKINRSQNPTFSKYNEKTVIDSLKIDFFKKCYLCEEVTRHFEVEHFFPQKYFPHLVNSYENLFYVCQKCNKIKPKKVNTCSQNEILNCCEIDIEEIIKLKLHTKECRVEVSNVSKRKSKILTLKIRNTINLLRRIYNGSNSNSNSCEDLRDEIKNEIENFRKILYKYEKTKLKRVIEREIKSFISKESSYSTFKRWIIRNNPKYRSLEKFFD